MTATGRPGEGLPKEPWAVVIRGEGGGVSAAVSTAFVGGLFWARGADGLLFGDNVRDLVTALAPHVRLDADFVRQFALIPFGVPGTATPFREIHRITPGTTASWTARQVPALLDPGLPATAGTPPMPRTIEWCGPQSWGEPTVEGPGTPQRYRATFDAGIDELLTEGPIYTQMSGGLDSTFVAASLVRHATPDNPVHALCHSPLPEARLSALRGWDPDDYPVAKAMAAAYPGRLVVHRVFAEADDRPLDAAAEAADARGVPTFNPANQIWIDRVTRIAAEAGAAQLFSGANGNAAFSYHHGYAAGYYLRQGHPLTAWRSLTPDAGGLPSRAELRARAGAPLLGAARQRLSAQAYARLQRTLRRGFGADADDARPPDYRLLVGLGHLGPQPARGTQSRAQYLEWLAGAGPLRTAGMFSGSAVPVLDAFTTRGILDLAAAITPLEWSRGPGVRGYARLLGAGRVPDSIRLRTRRGGQAWDNWYLIRNDRDRYYDEVSALSATPILGGWVDDAALRAQLNAWPWGEVHSPSRMAVLAMDRILSLAAFVRSATAWCPG